jgi:hypothetical protein
LPTLKFHWVLSRLLKSMPVTCFGLNSTAYKSHSARRAVHHLGRSREATRSCCGWRPPIAAGADHVLPRVRQWVLSAPWALRSGPTFDDYSCAPESRSSALQSAILAPSRQAQTLLNDPRALFDPPRPGMCCLVGNDERGASADDRTASTTRTAARADRRRGATA